MKKIRPLDVFIILVVVAAIGFSVFFLRSVKGKKAEVYIDREKIAEFNLDVHEQVKEIETRIGNVKLQLGNGEIRVLSTPCTKKICALTGAISHSHERILCLPAHMYIRVVEGEHKN